MSSYHKSSKLKIKKVATTSDLIHGRGGLAIILRYVNQIGLYTIIENRLGYLRKSKKGQAIVEVVKQILAYIIDGTRTSISGFDEVRKDKAYAALLEVKTDELVGSDIVKRFLKKFLGYAWIIWRPILHELFIWRLKLKQPKVIELYIDTMILDNDDALQREGVQPTYKPKKGFQPLHIIWENMIVDALFRSGSKHSNHGNDVQKAVKDLVGKIRSRYNQDVVIILKCDSGFLDEANFIFFEQVLGIYHISCGKLYQGIKIYADSCPEDNWGVFEKGDSSWGYLDFGNKLGTWNHFRRAIYTTNLQNEDGQLFLDFAKPDNLLYTNIGMNEALDKKLIEASGPKAITAENIINSYHQNGANELSHRFIKEFMGRESLPFERFGMNAAYYYLMLIACLLSEAFRQDVGSEVLPAKCYPNTLRRKLIDIAVKVVTTGGVVILKVTEETWKRVNFQLLWQRCNAPVPI